MRYTLLNLANYISIMFRIVIAEPLNKNYKKVVHQKRKIVVEIKKLNHRNDLLKKRKQRLTGNASILTKRKRQQETLLDEAKKDREISRKKLKNVKGQLSEKLKSFIDLLIDTSISDESDSS